ncbi:hypothetical protein J0910_30190 [Nocardiopsis sp. CNT-189]|uniref:hypothetical protein n=1 Tax=Nocardiopsis oceanisediminis TaxID=2816862 RepID=UPI003B33B1A9
MTKGDAEEIGSMLDWAAGQGLAWCLFSTEAMDPEEVCGPRGYPRPAACVHSADIPEGRKRGSPLWVEVAAQRLGVKHHELFYMGGSARDWRSAINAGVFYVHAAWGDELPSNCKAYKAGSAADFRLMLEHFLLGEPSWAYAGGGQGWELRCLLPAGASLPCTAPGTSFTLQDVLTYKKEVKIGGTDARNVLMLSVLANAYLEGLMSPGALMCIYPSSRPGEVSDRLSGYFRPASHLFRSYYKEDLLIRGRQALDTSRERVKAKRESRPSGVSIATQATSVHVGERYAAPGKLKGKTVIVADDFTTQGMSLDWARTLLTAAGAARVILLAIGKYGRPEHTAYTPQAEIAPYRLGALEAGDFTQSAVPLRHDTGAEARMRERFGRLLPLLAGE